jgi:hypothetical protein
MREAGRLLNPIDALDGGEGFEWSPARLRLAAALVERVMRG